MQEVMESVINLMQVGELLVIPNVQCHMAGRTRILQKLEFVRLRNARGVIVEAETVRIYCNTNHFKQAQVVVCQKRTSHNTLVLLLCAGTESSCEVCLTQTQLT